VVRSWVGVKGRERRILSLCPAQYSVVVVLLVLTSTVLHKCNLSWGLGLMWPIYCVCLRIGEWRLPCAFCSDRQAPVPGWYSASVINCSEFGILACYNLFDAGNPIATSICQTNKKQLVAEINACHYQFSNISRNIAK
jgi:hypothetical protein